MKDIVEIQPGLAIQTTNEGVEVLHYEHNGMVFEELTDQEYALDALCCGICRDCGGSDADD